MKKIPKGNKGLAKLPEDVRNKMGYMYKGGEMPKAAGGMMIMKPVKSAKGGASMKEMMYEKGGKMVKKVMIPAPKGHHWMSEGGRFYLMPHKGKFVPHKGAMLEAPFEVKTGHSKG